MRPFNLLVNFAELHPVQLTLTLYGLLILLILPVTLWGLLPSRGRRPIATLDQSGPAMRPGFTWPAGVKIERREESPPDRIETDGRDTSQLHQDQSTSGGSTNE
jgi:hypothetical protein